MAPNLAADILAITDLVHRQVAAVLRRDPAAWGATWTEGGSWKIDLFDQPLQGRAAMVEVFSQIIARFDFVAMSAFVTDIAVAGDRATGTAYSQEFMFPSSGGQKLLCGCFHDSYVRSGGGWLFQSRRYETLHRRTIIEPPTVSESPR